jgi:hypothetical protein
VRRLGVARVPDVANVIAVPHSISSAQSHASRFHVRIECISSMSNIQDDEIAVGLFNRKAVRQLTGQLINEIVAGCDHRPVCYRKNRSTINMITVHVFCLASKNRPVVVNSLPIDGETLGKVEDAVEREKRANVTDRITASICGDISATAKQRPENRDLGGNYGRFGYRNRQINARFPVRCFDKMDQDRGKRCLMFQRDVYEKYATLERPKFGTFPATTAS